MHHTLIGYIAVNARNVPVKSFGTTALDLESARAWVKDNAYLHSGLELREQTLVARRIYKPRVPVPPKPKSSDFTIPEPA